MRIAFWTSAGVSPLFRRASRRLPPISNMPHCHERSAFPPIRFGGLNFASARGRSSAGRARGWQPRGQGFDPPRLHRLCHMGHESAELLLLGYHACVAGDLDAIESLLDPDVEWVPAGESDALVVSRERVLEVVAERVAEDYHVVVDRAIGVGDRVVVSMRFSRIELDPSDERPLQSRRSYLLGRWAAVVYMRDGRVVRVEAHPQLEAALQAAGLEEAVA